MLSCKIGSIQPRTIPLKFVSRDLHLTITMPGFLICTAQVRGEPPAERCDGPGGTCFERELAARLRRAGGEASACIVVRQVALWKRERENERSWVSESNTGVRPRVELFMSLRDEEMQILLGIATGEAGGDSSADTISFS